MVAPYLEKADSLGASGLSSIESRFPIVKEPTASIQEKVVGVAGMPFQYAKDGKAYVFQTYDDEYEKSKGNRIIKNTKALIGTEIRITSDVVKTIADFITNLRVEGQKYAEKQKKAATE
jgi:hypothetical protein